MQCILGMSDVGAAVAALGAPTRFSTLNFSKVNNI